MKTYDKTCPMCGTLNRNLLLDETDGWMECEKCGAVTKTPDFMKTKKIPVFVMSPPPECLKKAT